eukprot:3713495-Prymnesium_polylepis.2
MSRVSKASQPATPTSTRIPKHRPATRSPSHPLLSTATLNPNPSSFTLQVGQPLAVALAVWRQQERVVRGILTAGGAVSCGASAAFSCVCVCRFCCVVGVRPRAERASEAGQ